MNKSHEVLRARSVSLRQRLNSSLLVGVAAIALLPSSALCAKPPPVVATITMSLDGALVALMKSYGQLLAARDPYNGVWLTGERNDIFKYAYLLDPKIVNTANLIKKIGTDYPPRTAVIIYWNDATYLYSWLLSANGILAQTRTKLSEAELIRSIEEARSSLGVSTPAMALNERRGISRGGKPNPAISPEKESGDIARLLLPPAIVGHFGSIDNLIVVPILGIGIVPFSALRPFDSNEYLADRISVSICPTIIDFWRENPLWNTSFKNPLIVGDPTLPGSLSATFRPLPGAREEATAVAKKLNATPLLGAAATKKTVIQRAPGADFLYFATHGVSSARAPLFKSFLLLSGAAASAADLSAQEPQWNAYEIQSLALSARLAVLSACEVGLGEMVQAGVIGLARAFQLAGVPQVIISLWNVNDRSTSFLMQIFVDKLQQGLFPAEALRRAMVEARATYPNPAKWAPFVVFGLPR